MITTPSLKGIHHLKLPVNDLTTSIAWYRRVFSATHVEKFDHYDKDGNRYAIILDIPGLDVAVELRWAPTAAKAIRGYDPVSFAVGSDDDLEHWRDHLDALGIKHSGTITALAGKLVVFADPDGTFLRVLTIPEGGFNAIRITKNAAEPTGPWLLPELMQHPEMSTARGATESG